MEYYDKLLLGIFATMAAGGSLGAFTAIPINMTVAVGGLSAIALMYHGMFHNAPVAAPSRQV